MQRTGGVEKPGVIQSAALDGLAKQLLRDLPPRVVIAGGPRCGKSILSEKLVADGRLLHDGEELVDRPEWAGMTKQEKWSAGSLLASRWLDEPGPWVCENVAMPRALRKWLKRNPSGKPCDLVVWLGTNVVARVKGQESMAEGCLTVWLQVRPELFRRGVRIRELNG
jgi:hypothetical protein